VTYISAMPTDPTCTRVGRARVALLAVSLAVGLLLVACGGGSDSPTVATPPQPTGTLAGDAELLQGRTTYTKYCAACHGVFGNGGAGTAFVGGQLLRDLPTAEEQAALVRKGRSVMPSFGETLTPEQIDAVVRYTREVLAPRPADGGS
jgi:mono/diheme cytochrome c family protein